MKKAYNSFEFGNVYIKTPKQHYEEAKRGYSKFVAFLKNRHIERK